MPIIQAEPGNWIDLYINTMRLQLNPESLSASDALTRSWDGAAIWKCVRHAPAADIVTITRQELALMEQSEPDRISIGTPINALSYGLGTAGLLLPTSCD